MSGNAPVLELVLTAIRSRTRLGEPIVIRLALRNRGAASLFVNGRMLLNHAWVPEAAREISIEVAGPEGYRSTRDFAINAGMPLLEHFVELEPGEALEEEYELTDYYSFHLPGTYRLRATYRNAFRAVGRPAWTGQMESNEIEIERSGD